MSEGIRSAAAFAALVLVACGNDPPKTHNTLLEVISLKGTCKEDHATKPGEYAGTIVRWRSDDSGAVSTYGFVMLPFATDQLLYDVQHPTEYQPPDRISFADIRQDTTQNHLTLHGISDGRGKDENDPGIGYNSTCELDVTKRGMELPDSKPTTKP